MVLQNYSCHCKNISHKCCPIFECRKF